MDGILNSTLITIPKDYNMKYLWINADCLDPAYAKRSENYNDRAWGFTLASVVESSFTTDIMTNKYPAWTFSKYKYTCISV